MEPIVYYYLAAIAPPYVPKDGSSVDPNELIGRVYQANSHIFIANDLASTIPPDLDLLGAARPKRWERVIKSLIYCYSGQLASRQEILRGRQIIQSLPNCEKKQLLNEQFCFGVLPYLLIGFKIHLGDRFQEDSNTLTDAVKFLLHLRALKYPEINSFLCTHRARNPPGVQRLISSVDTERAGLALKLQKALVSNMPSFIGGRVVWWQQEASPRLSSNMFPEMFIQYMISGEILELIDLIKIHNNQIAQLLKEISDRIEGKLVGLDSFSTGVESFLESYLGPAWRMVTPEEVLARNDSLSRIAIEKTLPEVRRFMPFYAGGNSFLGLPRIQEVVAMNTETKACDPVRRSEVESVIEWFYRNQAMTACAKAIYETAFYYLWGKRASANTNHVAIGIDRDHGEHQGLAWGLGYASSGILGRENSLLYARRTSNDYIIPGEDLSKISFRQFWR